MSILDLPIENQKAIAASLGVPFADWQRQVRRDLATVEHHQKPTRRTVVSARAKLIQARMDSETPRMPVIIRLS